MRTLIVHSSEWLLWSHVHNVRPPPTWVDMIEYDYRMNEPIRALKSTIVVPTVTKVVPYYHAHATFLMKTLSASLMVLLFLIINMGAGLFIQWMVLLLAGQHIGQLWHYVASLSAYNIGLRAFYK